MKKETLKTIMNAIVSAATAISADLVESIEERAELSEEKSRMEWLRSEWFSRFKSLPATYQVTTYKSRTHKVEFETDSAVLICEKEGGDVRVATPYVDEEGNKMFLVRDIYGVDEYAIPREEVTLLYKGSIENCWLRWYTFEKKNLG